MLATALIVRSRALDDVGRQTEREAVLAEALEVTEAILGDGDDQQVLHNHATILALQGPSEPARYWAARLLDSGWNRPQFLRLCRQLDLDPRCTNDAP
ncbi:MAG: hypothetical protein EA419_01480 [Wenzhouxiangella sp.]|nr:MAG: hypothetical protein EA419_01480 [Wenzhouxiangella sp.]